jgi:uncharacterized protein YndB with AHSA1/START domain
MLGEKFFAKKKMDGRVISAFTRVFRRAMPGHDGATRGRVENRHVQQPLRPIRQTVLWRQPARGNRSAEETSMNEPPVVRRETQIAAPPATVFAFLTDPEKIVSWMGGEATTETHPGGLYLLKGIGGDRARIARGAFREVVPVHRLVYTFGWEGSQEVPPGSSLVEIDLIERDGGTLLRMTHSGLPNEAQCARHATGWAHYVGRLAIAAAGGNPGIDHGPAH